MLLAEVADPGAVDAGGWTPRHFAAQAQVPAAVEILLAAVRCGRCRGPSWQYAVVGGGVLFAGRRRDDSAASGSRC
ncbi:hypothetical protein [Streptomyces sp. NEAU-sy36]|uniref:hypothetical protein n=1 Tax=Streptomyces sp. NEAU-sy36 TaxID=2751189 RepID=UPI0035A57699